MVYDCFINEDQIYLKSNMSSDIFDFYERNKLLETFIFWYYEGNDLKKKLMMRNECTFGNSEDFKHIYPELFI